MVMRAETRVDQQDTGNKKLSLILDAVQSLVAMMAARDERPGSVSRQQDQQTNDGMRHDSTHNRFSLTSKLELQGNVLEDRKLWDCISRLRSLANEENRTVNAEDLDGIVDDLQCVLAAAKDQRNDLANAKNLKRIGGLLSSAQMLSINGSGESASRDIISCSEYR